MNNMCIYCGKTNEFNVEHVFPCGLGGHDDSWILDDCVCMECNEKFSKLELELLRKSPIGISRLKFQDSGRKRGAKTEPPMLQPVRSFHFEKELGYIIEIEIKPKFIAEFVPQLIIDPPKSHMIADLDNSEHLLISKLRDLFKEDMVQVIEKSPDDDKKLLNVELYKLQEGRFKLVKSYEIEKAPTDGLWLAQVPPLEELIQDGVLWKLHSRFFLHKKKTVNYRSSSKESLVVDLNSLYYFLKELEELKEIPTAVERTLIKPHVDFSIVFDPEIVRRAIAKIGFNFLIKVMGRTYVSDAAFDDLKSSVLEGKPNTPHSEFVHGDIFHKLIGTPPVEHHAMYLMSIVKDDGRVFIIFVIQLYGGEPLNVFLSVDAPNPGWSFPIYFLVDYQSRRVKRVDSQEYNRTYCNTLTP